MTDWIEFKKTEKASGVALTPTLKGMVSETKKEDGYFFKMDLVDGVRREIINGESQCSVLICGYWIPVDGDYEFLKNILSA